MTTTPYQVSAGHHVYTVVDDLTTTYRPVAVGRVSDRSRGGPPRDNVQVRPDHPGLSGSVVDREFAVVGGDVASTFPDLATMPASFDVRITAAGYEPLDLAVVLPAGSTLPLDLGSIELEPTPVRLEGRVALQGARPRVPVDGALVFARNAGGTTSHPIVLRHPLHRLRPAATPVRLVGLTVAATTDVRSPARAGDRTIELTSRVGLGPDDVLRFGAGPSIELAVVESVGDPADLTLPGTVTLATPLHRGRDGGDPVQRVNPGAPILARQSTATVAADRAVVSVDGPIVSGVAETVQIGDGPTREYHALGAVTGAAGDYRLSRLGGADAIALRATGAGRQKDLTWTIDFARPVNNVNFILSP